MNFSGSYHPEDVNFLLKPVPLNGTDVHEKELLIQSGRRHYSEMIAIERPPDAEYLQLFHEAFCRNRDRFARDLVRLARSIASRRFGAVTIVSLARAGTPIGILLRRVLSSFGRSVVHYSVSIVRDRGIDAVALDYILARHDPASVIFVDGWTGKGAIAAELVRSVEAYATRRGIRWKPPLAVVADPAGVADLAATATDYLIPCSILNAVISGLISRTVLNTECVGPGDFHACRFYPEFGEHDLSQWFVEAVAHNLREALIGPDDGADAWLHECRTALRERAERGVAELMRRYDVTDANRVKPGVGEATRALLRRTPDRLVIRDPDVADVRHLVLLARRANVPIDHEPELIPLAAAIIRPLGNAT